MNNRRWFVFGRTPSTHKLPKFALQVLLAAVATIAAACSSEDASNTAEESTSTVATDALVDPSEWVNSLNSVLENQHDARTTAGVDFGEAQQKEPLSPTVHSNYWRAIAESYDAVATAVISAPPELAGVVGHYREQLQGIVRAINAAADELEQDPDVREFVETASPGAVLEPTAYQDRINESLESLALSCVDLQAVVAAEGLPNLDCMGSSEKLPPLGG